MADGGDDDLEPDMRGVYISPSHIHIPSTIDAGCIENGLSVGEKVLTTVMRGSEAQPTSGYINLPR